MIPTLADAVRTAMDRAITEGVPFGRRDVSAWIDGDTKANRPGASIMAQVDKEIRARKDAGEIVEAGTSPQGAALWSRPAPKPAPTVVVDVCEVLEVEHPAAGYVMEDLPEVDEFAGLHEAEKVEMGLEGPAVEFRETPTPFERFETACRAVLPNGIEWVWAAKTTDGQLFENPENAESHQEKLMFDERFAAFEKQFGEVVGSGKALIKTWEEFKAKRIAA